MRRKGPLLISLLVLAIAPYFALCFYALPYADDFNYAWGSAFRKSFIKRFIHEYMGWSGRYSAHILLCNHPMAGGSLTAYHMADFIALSFTLIAVFLFFRRFVSGLVTAVTVTLTMLLFYLCYMPQLSDGVYWYTGVCNYELGSAFFLLHLAMFALWYVYKGPLRGFYFFAAAVSLILSIGFNELGAALIPSYYLLALILLYRDRATSGAYRAIVAFFCIAFVSSSILAFAPGNRVRTHQYHDHFHLFHSLLFASLQTVRFIVIWLGTIPSLLLSLLVLARAGKLPDTFIFRFDHRVIISLLVFTIYLSAFMPYLTTGILGQHRTINYAFFYCILLWLWWLISVSKQYSLYKLPAIDFAGSKGFAIMILSIAVMALSSKGGCIIRDWRQDKFTTYREEFMQRQDEMFAHPDRAVLPLSTVPETFKIVDASLDTTYWVNKVIKQFRIKLR